VTELLKLDQVEGLAKAVSGLASTLHKAAATHEGLATHHAGLAKTHSEHAAFTKGMADGMANDHEMKAYMGKAADCDKAAGDANAEISKLHKAHADLYSAFADGLDGKAAKTAKAAGDPANPNPVADSANPNPEATGDAINGMIEKAVGAVLERALTQLATSGEIDKTIEAVVVAKVNERLGSKVVSDGVHKTFQSGPVLVPRTGSPQVDSSKVSPELAEMVGS
jgi:hypothetical protein